MENKPFSSFKRQYLENGRLQVTSNTVAWSLVYQGRHCCSVCWFLLRDARQSAVLLRHVVCTL